MLPAPMNAMRVVTRRSIAHLRDSAQIESKCAKLRTQHLDRSTLGPNRRPVPLVRTQRQCRYQEQPPSCSRKDSKLPKWIAALAVAMLALALSAAPALAHGGKYRHAKPKDAPNYVYTATINCGRGPVTVVSEEDL